MQRHIDNKKQLSAGTALSGILDIHNIILVSARSRTSLLAVLLAYFSPRTHFAVMQNEFMHGKIIRGCSLLMKPTIRTSQTYILACTPYIIAAHRLQIWPRPP